MIKEFLEKQGKKGAKRLVILLLAGVFMLLVSTYLSRQDGAELILPSSEAYTAAQAAPLTTAYTAAETLAQGLEDILSRIQGAGQVRVMLTMGYSQARFAQNVQQNTSGTTEEDGEGGIRNVETTNTTTSYVMVRQPDGSEAPLSLAHVAPNIEGIIIVAAGGGDVAVRDALMRAVQALTGVPPHRIQVFQMQ